MIEAVPGVAAMTAYALADLHDPGAVSLAQNESAFPPSPLALQAGREAIRHAALYPDPDWRALRHAITEVHGIDADCLLCGAGSMELIGCLIRAFSGPADEVLGTRFGYLFAATATQQAQARYVQAAEPGMRVCADRLLEKVSGKTKIVFICNPGNPTGTRMANRDILRLRDGLPASVLLVVDQAYGEFDDQDPRPVFDLVARGDTVVTRTFSKAYGLASARVGWGVFPAAIAAQTRKLLNPNNISGAAQAMAQAAMLDTAHMRKVVAQTAAIRIRFSNDLRAAGFDVVDSHTNFVLIRFPDAAIAQAMDKTLRKAGFVLRAMGGYGLPHCLRATMGTRNVMSEVAKVMIAMKDRTHDDA